jgi:hypothetical protein
MAANDIVLKDQGGNPVSYSNVDLIGVLAHNADNEEYTQMFTKVSSMKFYLLSNNGNSTWTVQNKRTVLTSGEVNRSMCLINESDCREYGKELASGNYQVVLLFTAKDLTVGNTYTTDELG